MSRRTSRLGATVKMLSGLMPTSTERRVSKIDQPVMERSSTDEQQQNPWKRFDIKETPAKSKKWRRDNKSNVWNYSCWRELWSAEGLQSSVDYSMIRPLPLLWTLKVYMQKRSFTFLKDYSRIHFVEQREHFKMVYISKARYSWTYSSNENKIKIKMI